MKVIGLLGAECTGKSTVARQLAAQTPATVVPEKLREFVDLAGRTPLCHEQSALMSAQRLAIDSIAADSQQWVIADPAPAMTAIYSLAYFDDSSLLDDAIADCRKFAVLLWCRPDIPWVADGLQRDGAEMRAAVDALIADRLLPDLESEVPVANLRGNVAMRMHVARTALQGCVAPLNP